MEMNRKELIRILVPDYQDAIYQIDNLTDEEINIILEYGEIYGFPLLSDLKDDLITYIQDKIIKSLIELEFIDKKDAHKFCDEYNEDIYDFCVYDEFISREYPGTYYIYVDERSFVERIFEDNDNEFSNWEQGNIIDDFSEWCSANSLSEAEDKFYLEYHKDIDSGKLEIVQVLLDD